jgi:hypothetical protein
MLEAASPKLLAKAVAASPTTGAADWPLAKWRANRNSQTWSFFNGKIWENHL